MSGITDLFERFVSGVERIATALEKDGSTAVSRVEGAAHATVTDIEGAVGHAEAEAGKVEDKVEAGAEVAFDDVRNAIVALVGKVGRGAAEDLLKAHGAVNADGAASIADIKPADYAKVHAEAQAKIASAA